jgi:hypothetical protein
MTNVSGFSEGQIATLVRGLQLDASDAERAAAKALLNPPHPSHRDLRAREYTLGFQGAPHVIPPGETVWATEMPNPSFAVRRLIVPSDVAPHIDIRLERAGRVLIEDAPATDHTEKSINAELQEGEYARGPYLLVMHNRSYAAVEVTPCMIGAGLEDASMLYFAESVEALVQDAVSPGGSKKPVLMPGESRTLIARSFEQGIARTLHVRAGDHGSPQLLQVSLVAVTPYGRVHLPCPSRVLAFAAIDVRACPAASAFELTVCNMGAEPIEFHDALLTHDLGAQVGVPCPARPLPAPRPARVRVAMLEANLPADGSVTVKHRWESPHAFKRGMRLRVLLTPEQCVGLSVEGFRIDGKSQFYGSDGTWLGIFAEGQCPLEVNCGPGQELELDLRNAGAAPRGVRLEVLE